MAAPFFVKAGEISVRRLMWFTIGFAFFCGISAYVVHDVPVGFALCAIALLLLCAMFAARRWQAARRGFVVLLGCMVGLVWSSMYGHIQLYSAALRDGTTEKMTLTASGYSYETAYGCAVDGTVRLDGKRYQIKAYINEMMEIEPGDTITGAFRLRYTAPGGREDATYHAGNGMFLLGYQKGEITHTAGAVGGFYPSRLAYGIKQILRNALPEDVFAFAKALLLGDSSELDYATDTAFKVSGIRHIIAVSGLHVTILYTLINTAAFKNRYLTALLAFPTLLVFAAVAGFTPSVSRACIMVGLMILAQVFNREYDSPTALSFASLTMLIANPLVITSVSFQLSVGCVAGILLFQTPISDWLKSILGNPKGKNLKVRLKRWFITSVSVTLGAMSLTTPLSAYYFGVVSLIGVVTNLLTLWVVNLVFNGLVVLCLLNLISVQTASVFGWILAWPVRYVVLAAKVLSRFPLAAVYTTSVYIVAWLVFVYALLCVFLLSGKRHPVQLICCGVLGLCMALLASWAEPLRDDVRMTVLDVGQGQSIILQSEGKTFLVDCGGDSDEEAADIAAETLLSQGIFRIDGIILTHGDSDHSGGVENLLSRVRADVILMPVTTGRETMEQIAGSADGQVIAVKTQTAITFGKVRIEIFGPIFAAESNENSLCVLFTREDCDILITGDRGELGEMMLLREAELPQLDVLVAGHHGSKYSTNEELLQAVQPYMVIISAGEDNPYGHPAEELLERLDKYGCIVHRTDLEGTIIYRR